jgi:hypothetical protein
MNGFSTKSLIEKGFIQFQTSDGTVPKVTLDTTRSHDISRMTSNTNNFGIWSKYQLRNKGLLRRMLGWIGLKIHHVKYYKFDTQKHTDKECYTTLII